MELQKECKRNVELLLTVLENFRKLDTEMPLQYAVSFLNIALNEGLSIQDLEGKIHMSQSATSRNVQALSKLFKPRVPGHDLVESFEDPMDRRKKVVRLTSKGRTLFNTIAKSLERMNNEKSSSAEKGGRKAVA